MNDDIDTFCGKIKEPVRFDEFERLVHHCRAVDADFRPHLPGWMRERLVDRGAFHIGARRGAKRSAAGSEHHACDLIEGSRRFETLKERVVFAVDRNDADSFARGRLHDDRARRDERFFVGEGDVAATTNRGEHRLDSRRTHHCREHEVAATSFGSEHVDHGGCAAIDA